MIDFDLNLVRLFVVVARTGTLSAAAQELALPVSSVGRSMSKLEQQLGVLLVRRGPRGISLTDSGLEYLSSCKKALRRLQIAGEAIQDQRTSPRGVIRVTSPVTTARSVLLPLLPEFLRLYPELRVELKTYASDWEQEPRETIDVFFKNRKPRDSGRHTRNLPSTRRGLFASRTFVRSVGMPATPNDLLNYPCVGMDSLRLTRGKETVVVSPLFRVVSEDPVVFQSLVRDGVGVGIIPLVWALQPDARKDLIAVLPDWEPEPTRHCVLFTGPSHLTPKVKVFLTFIEQFFGTDRDPRLKNLKSAEGLFLPQTRRLT